MTFFDEYALIIFFNVFNMENLGRKVGLPLAGIAGVGVALALFSEHDDPSMPNTPCIEQVPEESAEPATTDTTDPIRFNSRARIIEAATPTTTLVNLDSVPENLEGTLQARDALITCVDSYPGIACRGYQCFSTEFPSAVANFELGNLAVTYNGLYVPDSSYTTDFRDANNAGDLNYALNEQCSYIAEAITDFDPEILCANSSSDKSCEATIDDKYNGNGTITLFDVAKEVAETSEIADALRAQGLDVTSVNEISFEVDGVKFVSYGPSLFQVVMPGNVQQIKYIENFETPDEFIETAMRYLDSY